MPSTPGELFLTESWKVKVFALTQVDRISRVLDKPIPLLTRMIQWQLHNRFCSRLDHKGEA